MTNRRTLSGDYEIGRNNKHWRTPLLLSILFVVISLAIRLFADPSCLEVGGTCAQQTDRYGIAIVKLFEEHGALVTPGNASEPLTIHPPGYALIMGVLNRIFGDPYIPIVVLQVILLLVLGLFMRNFTNSLLPGYGTLAMALIVFNPNVLGQVNVVQTDGLHLVFLTGSFLAAMSMSRKPSIAAGLMCGLLLGITLYIRPQIAQVAVVSMPITFPILAALGGHRQMFGRSLLSGCLGALLAFGMVSPWLLHQNAAGENFRMSSKADEHLLLLDSLMYLNADRPGTTVASERIDFTKRENTAFRKAYPNWESISQVQKTKFESDYIRAYYIEFPFSGFTFLQALITSWARVLLSGGEGDIHRLFGIEFQSEENPVAFYLIKAVALSYAVILRLVAILGLIEIVRRGHYAFLVISLGLISMFVVSTLLVGQPRYRLAVEPQLMLMAVYGIAGMKGYFERRRNRRAAV